MAVTINTSISNSDYGMTGLRGNNLNSATGESTSRSDTTNGSLSSATTGSTVSGEVVDVDGNKITLKLENNQTISARLAGSADISVGQKMTFEVAKSDSRQMELRPLYANLANNSAVYSALKQAMLPINNSTISFTNEMMREGMPINKNALFAMQKNAITFPDADPVALVQMTKIGMPLTQNNITQYENYMNFEHQIINDVINMADGLTSMLKDSILINNTEAPADASIANAVENTVDNAAINNTSIEINTDTTKQILDLIDIGELETLKVSSDDNLQLGQEVLANSDELYNPNLSLDAGEQTKLLADVNELLNILGKDNISGPIDAGEVLSAVKDLLSVDYNDIVEDYSAIDNSEDIELNQSTTNSDNINVTNNGEQSNTLANTVQAKTDELSAENNLFKNITSQFKNIGQKILLKEGVSEEQILKAQAEAEDLSKPVGERAALKLQSLIKSDGFSKLFNDSIKAQMSINPADVAKDGKLDELYDRILKQSNKITELMQSLDKADTSVAKSASNISDNVNFMNQLNEFVNYVQLPLKMAGENAHGELYVYTKRKNLKNNEGNFSALLHLDMDHLGPMDVHIAMTNFTKVNTHFYLQTDELLDFIESHIDELDKRLVALGYNTSIAVTKKNDGSRVPITEEFVKDDSGTVSNRVSKLCFDVRA